MSVLGLGGGGGDIALAALAWRGDMTLSGSG